MGKKIKGALTFVLLATLSLGGIAYFSSGFSNWTADGWRDRLTPVSSEEPPVSSEEPPVSSEEPYEDFTTFETEAYFNDAFGDLVGYEIGSLDYDGYSYDTDYGGSDFLYYAFPVYYNFSLENTEATLYYSNDYFNFYLTGFDGKENVFTIVMLNYTGSEEELYFGRLNSSAMAIYIENEPVLTDS